MEPKAHHKRHKRYSQRKEILLIAVLVLVFVLALVVGLLWWVNRPPGTGISQ
jgi:cytoskeletal protein RodZ